MQLDMPNEVLLKQAQRNLFDYMRETSSYSDDTVVFEYFHKKQTFGSFCSMVYQIADTLLEMGIESGDKVLISLITTPASISLVYACSAIGAVSVMTDVRLPTPELYSLICETKVKIAFISDFSLSDPKLLASPKTLKYLVVVSPCDTLPWITRFFRSINMLFQGKLHLFGRQFASKIVYWNDLFKQRAKQYASERLIHAGDGELLFTTSGTTGTRKYVRIRASALNLAAYRFHYCMDLSQIRSVLSVMPIFTCYGFLNSVHAPLVFSKKLFIYPIYRFGRFPHMLKKTKASASFGVLGQWESLTRSRSTAKTDFSFLKYASWGGDGCTVERLTEINRFLSEHHCSVKLCQGYGMTETVSAATLQTPEDYKAGSAGKPLPFVKICIVEEGSNHILPAGIVGEICIHSFCQTTGYYQDDISTKDLIRVHDDGCKWIHSGDLGYLDEDNHLFVVGRKKRMIVSENGTKVFLSRLEGLVLSDDHVADCAAVSVSDTKRNHCVSIALFVKAEKQTHTARIKRRIANLIHQNLPDYLYPDQIIIVRRIPKTALGKTDYPELTALWLMHCTGTKARFNNMESYC